MNEILRTNLESELLFTSEVCDELGISRQQLYYLVNTNKLIPVKRLAKEGSVFLRSDIENYKKDVRHLPSPLIYGMGSTEGSLECFKRLSDKFSDVSDVYVYDTGTYHEYAMSDGFYCANQPSGINQFSVVAFPSCVMVTPNERFMFGGFTCGYGGTGPHGTMTMLRELGVDEDLITYVTHCARLHYRRIGSNWELEEYVERPDQRDSDFEEKKQSILSSHWAMNHPGFIWYHNGSIVIPVFKNPLPSTIGAIFLTGRKDSHFYTPQGLLNEYSDYIPNPYSFTVYEDAKAIKGGFSFYSSLNGGERIFNAVLTDRSGRQLWFTIPNTNSLAGNRIVRFFSDLSEKAEYIKGDSHEIQLDHVPDEYETTILKEKRELQERRYKYYHVPTRDIPIKDGVFRCPANWIELNPDVAKDAVKIRVIEVQHSDDVIIPHFVYYLSDNKGTMDDMNDDETTAQLEKEEVFEYFEHLAAEKWPKLQEYIDAEVKPVYKEDTREIINMDEMLSAPVIGHFPVAIFTQKEISIYEKVKQKDEWNSLDFMLFNEVEGSPYGSYMILNERHEGYNFTLRKSFIERIEM